MKLVWCMKLLSLLLLFTNQKAWSCSETYEPINRLPSMVNEADDIVLGSFRFIQDGLVYVDIIHSYKGDIDSSRITIKPPISDISGGCSIYYSHVFESLQYYVEEGYEQPFVFFLFDDGVSSETNYAVAVILNGSDEMDFDRTNSPFLDILEYVLEHGTYPFDLRISGKESYAAGYPAEIELKIANAYENPIEVYFPGKLGDHPGPEDPDMFLWIGLNDEDEGCPTCFSRFMQPIEAGDIDVNREVQADLSRLYEINEIKNYAVEARLYVRISPTYYYRDFLGKFLQFNLKTPTAYQEGSWGGVKFAPDEISENIK